MVPEYRDPTRNQENEKFQPNEELAVNSRRRRLGRSILSLPIELQLHILPFLDYQSLRNLSQTSEHFYSLFASRTSRAKVKDSLLALELDPERRKSVLLNHRHFPCYGCLRILHARDRFCKLDTYRNMFQELGGDHAPGRRCMSCRYSYLAEFGDSGLFVRGGQCWVACADCRQVKRYVAGNAIMKIAWMMARKCVECAKMEVDEDAQKKEVWRELLARHYRWKQAAVGLYEPVKVGSVPKRLAEESPKPGKKIFGLERWGGLRKLFTLGR
jgi:F-box domain